MIIQFYLIEKKRKKKQKQANTLAANPVTFGGGFGREGCVYALTNGII
jgi:hypothetical protein